MAAYSQYNAGYVGTLVTDSLMKGEKRRLQAIINNLATLNAPFQRNNLRAFIYMGVLYVHESVNKRHKTPLLNLHESFHTEMSEYLEDAAKVALDEKTIQQLCYVLTKEAESSQHIRNMLPDVLGKLFTQIGPMERTIPFEDCHSESLVEQTNKLLPMIHAYMAGNLLY